VEANDNPCGNLKTRDEMEPLLSPWCHVITFG
jgi:hypothetical protein